MGRETAGRKNDPEGAPAGNRQAWIRAGAGLSLIALLLGLLALVEQRYAPSDEAASERGAPIDAAQPAGPPAVADAPVEPVISSSLSLPEGKEQGVAMEPSVAAPEASSAPEIAPPGARQADEPVPSAILPAAAEDGQAPRLILHSAPEEPDAPPAPEPAVRAAGSGPPAPGKGFLLQLGVFGDGNNAQALYDELRRQGVPARLETRVVAGPFSTRASAAAARERLLRAGMVRGLVVPER